MSPPATVDEISRPKMSGRLINPPWVGDLPSDIWKYWDRNTVPPNMARPTRMLATVASDTVRLRKISSGIIGSGTRDSTYTANARMTNPAETRPAVHKEPQAYLLPARVPHTNRMDTPTVMSAAPSQSMRTSRRTVG